MKIACVIPTRGNRPEFVKFAVQQMQNQTLKPDCIHVVDHPPVNDKFDIASRFRIGIERSLTDGADVIFFIEDDDFYTPQYIETMINAWGIVGCPQLFGLDTTFCYHLKLRMAGNLSHLGRASMHSSMISKEFDMSNWPKDPERFVDLKIWRDKLNIKEAITPSECIVLSMKHGQGKCGGSMHDPNNFLKTFRNKRVTDSNLGYLKQITQSDFLFYESIINQRG